jgi:hypothetical protein
MNKMVILGMAALIRIFTQIGDDALAAFGLAGGAGITAM